MTHVKKKKKFETPAGYASAQHEMFEDKAKRMAELAERKGETCFEYGGTVFVKVEGGGFVEWVRADPKKIVTR